MFVVVIIFMVVATIFAVSSIAYVIFDIILERREKQRQEEQKNAPAAVAVVPLVAAVPEPEPEPEPEQMPELVEHIDAEQADAMISDDLAMKTVRYESPAGKGEQGIINIGVIDAMFEADSVITLALLKEKGLLPKKTGRIKILADGILNKPLTIKAENYSIQAIKMIELTGGTVVILKD